MSKNRSTSRSTEGRSKSAQGSSRGAKSTEARSASRHTKSRDSSGGKMVSRSAAGGKLGSKGTGGGKLLSEGTGGGKLGSKTTGGIRKKASGSRRSRSKATDSGERAARTIGATRVDVADVGSATLRESAKLVSRALEESGGAGTLITLREAGLAEVPLPVEVLEAASEVMRKLASGKHPSLLVLENDELTSEQAAAVLGVSRPHLNQILEAEGIPHRRVGDAERGHRRIEREQVMALKERRKRSAGRMDELMQLAEEIAD